jgi:hypothetical protein
MPGQAGTRTPRMRRCRVEQGRGEWRRWIEDTGDTEAPETVRKGAGDIGGCAVGMGSVGV